MPLRKPVFHILLLLQHCPTLSLSGLALRYDQASTRQRPDKLKIHIPRNASILVKAFRGIWVFINYRLFLALQRGENHIGADAEERNDGYHLRRGGTGSAGGVPTREEPLATRELEYG